MKTHFLNLAAILALNLGWLQPVVAQVTNGDFETRNAVPQTDNNVGPANTVVTSTTSYTFRDDLPNWDAVPYYIDNNYDQRPGYLTTDGVGSGNVAFYGGTTHNSSIGCVSVYQESGDGNHNLDNFIYEQLATPLLAGHRYLIQFWANRIDYSAYHAKVAAYVTSVKPVFKANSPSQDLILSAGSKVVNSPETYAPAGWFLVSGYVDIPANETGQYLTIGPSTFNQVLEPAPWQRENQVPNHLIDDVSITEIAMPGPCPAPPRPEITLLGPNPCYARQVSFEIANRDPAYSYTITASGGNALPGTIPATTGATPGTIAPYPFRIKTGTPARDFATFTVKATRICDNTYSTSSASSSASSSAYFSYCTSDDGFKSASTSSTAYPNPATESLTLPTGATEAVLFNSQGRAVAWSDKAGRLDTHRLPAGIYNLQMQQNGKRTNQRIEVKH